MYQRDFEARLKQGLPKAVLFYGENDYMCEHYIERYKSELDAREDALTLYFDEYDFERAKGYLAQSSLFGGTNLLIVKTDKKIPKKELETLVSLTRANDDNYLVYHYTGAPTQAKSLQNAFSDKTGGVWVRFFEPNVRESMAVLEQKARALGIDIDRYALQHLLLVLNNDLSLAVNELYKLAVLDGKVTAKEIDRLVYSTAPLGIETLWGELFDKKPVAPIIEKLLEFGEDEFSIVRALQYFINDIFLINAYIKLHGQPDFRAIFGYAPPKQVQERKQMLALKVDSGALLRLYETVLAYELMLKKAPATQREGLLYGLLVHVQSLL